MLDGEHQRKLRNVLQELGTEESWYATSVREREYHEGAFLRMCQAVALGDAYDPALDLGLPPVLGGPRTSRPWEEKSCSVRGLRVLRALGCAQKTALTNDAGCSADERVQRQHKDDSTFQAASTKECPSRPEGLEFAQTQAGAHEATPLRSTSGATEERPTRGSTSASGTTQPRTRGLRIRGRRRKEKAST
jgi:hypothetical protein